jgi:hypothetical protein
LLLWFCMREENVLAEVADGGEIMKPTQSWLWRDGVIHVKWVVVIVNVINDSVIVNITNQVLTIGYEVEAKKESCSSSLCCVLSVCFFLFGQIDCFSARRWSPVLKKILWLPYILL